MKIHCNGGFREVGRNAVLVETKKASLLLDSGIHVEDGEPPLPCKKVDAILLGHAHLDHVGTLPVQYKKFRVPVFGTAATFDQAHLLLNDSIKIARLKARPELFNHADLAKAIDHEKRVTFGQQFEFNGIPIDVYDAGHVPGSAIFVFEAEGKRIMYTSDFNTAPTRLLNGASSKFKDIDVLIMENTYGCVAKGTNIILNNGKEVPIEDIKPGFTIKTIKSTPNPSVGEFPVSKVWKSNYTGKMLSIVTSSGRRITITPNHPCFIQRGHKTRKMLLVNASQIKIGDRIPAVIQKKLPDKKVIYKKLHLWELEPSERILIRFKNGFIKDLVYSAGTKRSDVARMIGVPENTLKEWISGKPYTNPNSSKNRSRFIPLESAKALCRLNNIPYAAIEMNAIEIKVHNSPNKIQNLFPLNLDSRMAKLLAKSLSDGHINPSGFEFQYFNTNDNLVNEAVGIASELGFRPVVKQKKNIKIVYTPILGAILHTLGCPIRKVEEMFSVPDWIVFGTENVKASFIQGAFDDEGNVAYCKTKNRVLRRLLIKMAKREDLKLNLLEYFSDIKQMLSDLGVDSKIEPIKGYSDRILLILRIQGYRNIVKFMEKINFVHDGKSRALSKICLESWREVKRLENEDIEFEKIIFIEETHAKDLEVYDLTIGELGEWGNFAANGIIVHNSRDHPNRAEQEKKLFSSVNDTILNEGIALMPVFAVGRGAEVLMVLNSFKPKFPIYLDGMARDATEIILKYPELLRNAPELEKAVEKAIPLYTDEERRAAIKEPCAIVTTGGVIEGGPAIQYIKALYTRPECSINFTGFMIPKTAGRYLVDTGRFVHQGADLAVKMEINQFDFSAHAGRSELLDFVKKMRPEKIICVHGDQCERFATELKGRFAVDAIAPKIGDVLEI